MLSPILLDDDWACEVGGRSKHLASIADFQLDPQISAADGVWFRRMITLDVTDYCVNYVLQFDSIPKGAAIYMNDERLMLDPADSRSIDITAYVALGENELAFLIERNSTGSFDGVRLQPVPCE
jgi:hypothetical protein